MKIWRKYAAVFCAVLLALSVTGCGTKGKENNGTVTAGPTQAGEARGDKKESITTYPVTVTDSDGNAIEIKSEPQRIVSVGPNITEILFSLGSEKHLVGRTDYCDFPEKVSEIDSIGGMTDPDLEKILSLEPDLVIGSAHFDMETTTKLQELGIPVLFLYEEKSIDGVYTMIETLGTALNKQKEATEIVTSMKSSIEETKTVIKNLDLVSVYYVVGFGEGGEYTAGGDTFMQGIITAAGGKNSAEDVSGWSYSLEKLLEADPDVILLADYNYDAFISTEPYSNLSAVKNGKVYVLDINLVERQGPRNAEGIRKVAELLHPDAFQNK